MAVVLDRIIERLNKCNIEIPVVLRDPDGIVSELVGDLEESGWVLIHLSDLSEEFMMMLEAEQLVQQGRKVLVYIGGISDKSLVHLAEYWDRGNGLTITAAKLLSEIGVSHDTHNKKMAVSIVKIGLKRDEEWWNRVREKGVSAVLREIEEGLFAFLEDPEELEVTEEEKYLLYEYVLKEHFGLELLPETSLKEASRKFGEFVLEKYFLENPSDHVAEFYKKWEDSKTYEKVLMSLARDFEESRKEELRQNIDKFMNHHNHPFVQIEKELFMKTVREFLQEEDKAKIMDFVRERAKKRNRSGLEEYTDEFSWKDFSRLGILLEKPNFSEVASLDDLIELYAKDIWKFDQLWRELQNLRLPRELKDFAKEEIQKVLTEIENFWRNYYDPGRVESKQAGLIRRILENPGKVAVIVVDAMRFELAKSLNIDSGARIEVEPIIAVTPTETLVGMGALFSSGKIEKRLNREKRVVIYDRRTDCEITTIQDREDNLKTFIEDVQFLSLDDHSKVSSDKIVLKSREIDKLGHDDLSEFFSQIIAKIKDTAIKLLQKGYEVHMVSDHGFYLSDAESKIKGDRETAFDSTCRYKLSGERPDSSERVVVESVEDTYIGYALGSTVFSDRAGVFLHGGATLQEVLIPHVVITPVKRTVKLGVKIKNKEDLRIVQRNTFDVVLVPENRMFVEPNRVYLEVGKKKIEVEDAVEDEVRVQVTLDAEAGETVRVSVRDKDTGKLLDYVDVKFLPTRKLLF
ncbi:MAG TPA: hypothetical protein DHV12_10345 [Thermotogae bacterium]|nr:hypothetical protein [Thermotogota bacterium]HCZ07505.1 hypothetical protein [Thermotogota bacterium]